MTETPTPRPVQDSIVEMTEIVLPEDANPRGTIFGGRVLSLIDKCAAVSAMRHARCLVLTVAMDSVVFHNTVRLGDVLILKGRLNAAFGSSMEAEVEVSSEDPITGERNLTTTAFVTMVAVDEENRPRRVPPLDLAGADDERRYREAKARRERRLSAR